MSEQTEKSETEQVLKTPIEDMDTDLKNEAMQNHENTEVEKKDESKTESEEENESKETEENESISEKDDSKMETEENDKTITEDKEVDNSLIEENDSLTEEKEESLVQNSTAEKSILESTVADESLCLNASSIESEGSMEESIEEEEKDSHNTSTLSAKRNRKKVERFVQETKPKEKVEDAGVIEGDGVKLGSIVFIDAMLQKTPAEDLRVLHRLFFNRPGTHFEVKRNIRKFNGFCLDKDKDDKEYEKKLKKLEKLTVAELKKMVVVLGLEKKGTKQELVERLLEFINCPVDKGQNIPSKRKSNVKQPKGKKVKDKKGNDAKDKKGKEVKDKKGNNAKDKKGKEKTNIKEVKGKKKVEAKPESDSDEDSASSEEEEAPKPVKKPTPKKTTKPAAKKRKLDSVSADSPAAKKKKDNPPTNAEIKTLVQKILNKANLEEVTMKKVCQQVYDSYPKHDLLPKKDFIKETVKTILS